MYLGFFDAIGYTEHGGKTLPNIFRDPNDVMLTANGKDAFAHEVQHAQRWISTAHAHDSFLSSKQLHDQSVISTCPTHDFTTSNTLHAQSKISTCQKHDFNFNRKRKSQSKANDDKVDERLNMQVFAAEGQGESNGETVSPPVARHKKTAYCHCCARCGRQRV